MVVMAFDLSGRDRGGQRRQKFTRKGLPFDSIISKPQPTEKEMPVKTPVILMKPPHSVANQISNEEATGKVENHKLLKATPGKTASVNNNHVKPSRPGILPADGYNLQQQSQLYGSAEDKTNGGPRLVLPLEMSQSVKVVDDQTWSDAGIDWLLDQPDFLVLGILGMQGVGKSTILSHLAGTGVHQPHRSFAFKPQNKDAMLNGVHMTSGIDMYVTEERTILLDSQAMMSPSVLDALIYQEKKCPSEFSHVENAAEIQSLKIASFMLTVCNVVVIVVDWFIDPNVFNFLRMAEMLKPLINNSGSSDGSVNPDSNEYFPHVVFILNKANDTDFQPGNRKEISQILASLMANSKLKITGMPVHGRNRKAAVAQSASRSLKSFQGSKDSINLFILPKKHGIKTFANDKDGDVVDMQSGFVGHPGFEELMKDLGNCLLSAPRQLPALAALSEKAWFHYASRVWEFMKRSSMVSEYNRLLS